MDIICIAKKKLESRQITSVVEIKGYEQSLFAPKCMQYEDLTRTIQAAFAGMEEEITYDPWELTKEGKGDGVKA